MKALLTALWLASGILLFSALPVHGQEAPNRARLLPTTATADAQNVRLIADSGGAIGAATFVGSRAYVGAGYRLAVLDWSDNAAPAVLGQSETMPALMRDLAIDDEHAYVADDVGGLHILNIANPAAPREVAVYEVQRARHIAVDGELALVGQRFSDGGGTLQLVNVANPAAPFKVGEYSSPDDVGKAQRAGNLVFFNDTGGLRVLDIGDPSTPAEIGYYPVGDTLYDFQIAGDRAYLAAGIDGLRILDLNDPSNPREIGFFDTRVIVRGIQIAGQHAYIIDDVNGLRVVDVSAAEAPRLVATLLRDRTLTRLALSGRHLYATDRLNRVQRLDISDPAAVENLNSYAAPGFANDVYVSSFSSQSSYAYVADGFYGLRIVQIDADAAPVTLGVFQTADDALAVTKDFGDYAYVAAYRRGLRVIDVRDPTAPTEAGFYDTPGSARDLALFGGHAYVADGSGGLRIVDVRAPTAPVEVGFFDPYGVLGGVDSVALTTRSSTTYALLADDNLRIVNVTDRANPQQVALFLTPGNTIKVTVAGDYAYLLDDDHLLRIVDITTLAAPSQVAAYRYQLSGPITFGDDIQVVGNLAYITDGGSTLRVFDVSRPNAPEEIGYYDTTHFIEGVRVVDGTIYVAGGGAGLLIMHHPDCYRLTAGHTGRGIDPTLTPSNSPGCPTGEYAPQAFVTLGAEAAPDWRIGGWLGSDNDATTLATNRLTMPAADFKVLVNYVTTCYPLTSTHSGQGSSPTATPPRSETCAQGHYVAGEMIAIQAVPDAGWRIEQWSGVDDPAGRSTDAALTMPAGDHTAGVTYVQAPDATGDAYEDDDACTRAKQLAAGGVTQAHTLHAPGDEDWVRFDAAAGQRYRIEVTIPSASPADVSLEIYAACTGAPTDESAPSFAAGVRLDVTAAATGPLYLSLRATDAAAGSARHAYELSVRPLASAERAGENRALILVGGSLTNPDRLADNINYVTESVYALYRADGLPGAAITYLANDPNANHRTGAATIAALRTAITAWAPARLAGGGSLTLYLMDHGDPDRFYLDKSRDQVLAPQQLDGWLDQLEEAIPDLQITVIIEACYSGSFIHGDSSISKDEPGRLVITSTSQELLAYASGSGAYFSDFMVAGLQQGYSLHNSFRASYATVRELSRKQQEPWIDGNGNGVPNEPADITLATRQVSGAGAGGWAPYIVSVQGPESIENRRGTLQALVRDDTGVGRVWAVITPPSYRRPQASTELVAETLPTILLSAQGDDLYAAEYAGFDELGTYQIAFYAEDEQNLVALPKSVEVVTGSRIMLPAIVR